MERGLSPHLSRATLVTSRSWHLSRAASHQIGELRRGWRRAGPHVREGCRGFNGPVPPPLWMSGIKLYEELYTRLTGPWHPASHGARRLTPRHATFSVRNVTKP